MKIEVARNDDRMAPSGKAILRSIQNESIPVIDLVIRESFQNSLDASLDNVKETIVKVNITEVNTKKVAHYFEGIEDSLKEKFPVSSKVVSISDFNTSGLTGELQPKNKQEFRDSNIYKLIYGLNMNQEEAGSGGSWGLGKTSFFRLGLGIVVYYSRVRYGTGFQERLAACLIENSESLDPIMPQNDRGVAWWGSKESDDIYAKTIPITDSNYIKEILDSFSIKRYENDETGTTVIIPFIDENKVTLNNKENYDTPVYWWENSISSSIEMAIKRWYFPRIINEDYFKKFEAPSLIPFVNNNAITPLVFEPVFNWFYLLYKSSLTGIPKNEKISTKQVYVKRTAMVDPQTPVGMISYVKLSPSDLKMLGESTYLSPMAYLGDKATNGNNINGGNIIAYCRKPGMVIQYEINNSKWLDGLSVEENNYTLSFFVPNSSGAIHSSLEDHYNTLEDYIRDTENADHALWEDKVINARKITIIERIRKNVSKVLVENLIEKTSVGSSSRTNLLGRKFGNLFLPDMKYGNSSRRKAKDPRTQKPNRGQKANFDFEILNSQPLTVDEMLIEIRIKIPNNTEKNIYFEIESSDKKMDELAWDRIFKNELKFPFKISKLQLNQINNKLVDDSTNIRDFSMQKDIDRIYSGYTITNQTGQDLDLDLSIVLKISDITMQPRFMTKSQQVFKEGGEQ